MDPETQKKLDDFAALFDTKANAEELVAAAKALVDIAESIARGNEEERAVIKEQVFHTVKAALERARTKLETTNAAEWREIKRRISAIRDGKDGKNGPPGPQGEPGQSVQGPPGEPGKDGSPDTPQQIVEKLQTLAGDERLDKSAVRGLDDLEKQIAEAKSVRVSPGPSRGMYLYIDSVKKGLISNLNLKAGTAMAIAYSKVNGQDTLTFNASGGSGSGVTVETPTGTVDASNTTFTVSAEPKYVVSDGTTYFDGAGYSYAALTITMDVAPSASIRAII